MSSILLWLFTLILFAVGVAGIFIPALPGIGFVFAGTLLYAWATGFTSISSTTIIVFGVVALLAWLAEYFSSGIAAKLAGGKKMAVYGSFIGAIVGFMLGNAPGLLLGAFSGAFAGALYEGKGSYDASRIALLSVVGLLGAKLVQFLVALGIIIAFLIAVMW